MEKTCYILQQYDSNGTSINIFYNGINGFHSAVFSKPECATRFETIGDAMKVSASIYTTTNARFKAIAYTPKKGEKFVL